MTSTGSKSSPPNATRIRHLYSKFRSRSSNPEGFDAKLNYWIGAINEWCAKEKVCSFNLNQLRKAFKYDNLFPDLDCLRLVASEMKRRSNNLASRDYFDNYVCANRNQSGGWLTWGLESISKPIKFGFSLFNGSQEDEIEEVEIIDQSITNDTELINVNAVISGAKALITLLADHQMTDKCLKFDDFEKFMNDKWRIDPEQLNILLSYLTSTRQVVTMEDKAVRYIKFGDNVKFSDLDISLRRLESARELVEDDIFKIDAEMEKCRQEAKEAIKESNRVKAKSLLRRKKRLEDFLSKKEAQLDNIHVLSEQLLDVNSNKAVVNAYRECAEALKAAQMKHDNLNETIADVEEAFEHQNELFNDLGRAVSPILIDEEELEAELREFLEEEQEEQQQQQKQKIKGKSSKPEKDTTELKVTDDKIDELYARLENLRRPMGQPSPTNGPAARKIKKIAD